MRTREIEINEELLRETEINYYEERGFEKGFKEEREEDIKNTVVSYVRNGIDYKLSVTLLMSTFQLSPEEAVQKYEMYKNA